MNKDNKEVWLTVERIGKLYMDEEFIVGNEPVLFTVIDENKKRYLVMTYVPECIYHMVEISNNDLIDMLENRITMEQTFRKQKEIIRVFYDWIDNCYKFTKYDSTTFSSDLLPKEGEYYNLNYDYIKRYIDKLKPE